MSRKQRATPAVARIFDGENEAKLIALACSKPPKGRARWTLRLLESKVVELHIVDRAKRLHDRAGAQKNILQPHRRQCWVIPPKANSAFVAAMEDVLAIYTRPRDPDRPLVCLDETSKQLLAWCLLRNSLSSTDWLWFPSGLIRGAADVDEREPSEIQA